MVQIVYVEPDSPNLATVKKLWRAHSDTLGMMPAGAFDEYASSKHILGAVDAGQLVGYLLFRCAKAKAKITHLCVDQAAQGKGIARALVAELQSSTSHVNGIELKCRRDFGVSSLWPKLGFVAVRECPGRSAIGSTLTVWCLDYGKPTLFSENETDPAVDVVIDTNILIDLLDQRKTDSYGLSADWLQGEIRICVTDEILNDFDRHEDESIRRKRKAESSEFPRLTSTPDEYSRVESQLKPLLPAPKSPRDESDIRHLIRAASAGCKVFVSRDGPVLDQADAVYQACGLSIVRPAELIGRIDELLREEDYQRGLVAGTRQISRQRVAIVDGPIIGSIIYPNEPRRQLESDLHQFLADPHRFICERITNRDGTTLAFYVVDTKESFLDVPLFRICSHALSGTLSRTILMGLLQSVASHQKNGVTITDPRLNETQRTACRDLGFLHGTGGSWFKLAFTGLFRAVELADRIDRCGRTDESLNQLVGKLRSPMTAETVSEFEHLLWPGKLTGTSLANYIIPIRPEFAQHLFDEDLASQTLFGADVDLALNPESVYYRSARQRNVSFPGRILWYASDKGGFQGQKAIRACSRIAEVCVDKPKTLFRRFKRLGVYEWEDVFATAKHNLQQDVMAIRFHDTELLHPVPWAVFQEILQRHDIKTNLESPAAISNPAFEEIYALALNSPPVC